MRIDHWRPFALLAIATLWAGACGGGEERKAEELEAGATKAASTGNPKIAASEATFDFGKIKAGKDVEHVFEISNEGSAELVIEKARGT